MAYVESQLKNRKTLSFKDLQVNNVVLLGSYHYTDSDEKLSNHTHEDTMEICFLDKGYQTYVVDDHEFHLKGGDIFITFPGEKHSTGGYLQEKGTLYWFQVNMTLINNNFLSYQNEEAKTFIKNILGIPKRHFSINPEFKSLFDRLFLVGQESQSSFQRVRIYSIVSQILLSVLDASAGGLQNTQSEEMIKAVAFIKKNIDQNFSLEDLADHVHLSVSHFKTKFKSEIGTSPADFVQRQKIEKSEKLLRDSNSSITEIAYSLGYPSSQHFSSVFKKYTGKSPSEFKKTLGI